MINADILRLLHSPIGKEALAAAQAAEPNDADFLPLFQKLARQFPEPLARAAAEQSILRQRAKAKFNAADRMFFTRESLEQATPEPVAQHRAHRFMGYSRIFDLACGIGGDTLAFAKIAPVVAVDRDRERLLLLGANARSLNVANDVTLIQADLRYAAWRSPTTDAVFVDPARRIGGRRSRSIDTYEPPIRETLANLSYVPALAVKISPAVSMQELAEYDCEVEFVSWKGQLKEATLWFRAFKTTARRATVLPGSHSLWGEVEPELSITAPRRYLYEPDPSVLRAGLVRGLGRRLGAAQIDPEIAFLTSDELHATPFARIYLIELVLPFGLKTLRATLRERDVGRVTLKKRGSAIDVDSFTRRLRLRGTRSATVILTRQAGRPIAILVKPIRTVEHIVSDST
jgi:SAM-dependent methyltransferase